jgi:hypothetical protein
VAPFNDTHLINKIREHGLSFLYQCPAYYNSKSINGGDDSMSLGEQRSLGEGIKNIHNKIMQLLSGDNEFKYGDIIGVSRIIYEHYGVYVGDRKIIHYTTPSFFVRKFVIRKTDMELFLHGVTTLFTLDFLLSLITHP